MFVFAACVLLTLVATFLVRRSERHDAEARFANDVIAARERIHLRMESYLAMLRGAAGLLSADQPVAAGELRIFVDRLGLAERYPGTQGIGYSARLSTTGLADASARVRASAWPDVRVWPDAARNEVHAIVLLEPLDERNRVALGYDMYSEPTRREAMDRARDEGDVALSGKVTLVQEISPDKQAGALLYSPVYAGGVVPASLAERRAKLEGYVYAPLRAGDLFRGIFGDEDLGVAFDLYDGDGIREAAKMCSFGTPSTSSAASPVDERVVVAGRTWTVHFARAAGAPAARSLDVVVLLAGLVISGVVFVLLCAREKARAREIQATASALAAAELVRMKDTFVGVLGHDLRAPLHVIALTTSFLQRGARADQVEDLRRVRNSAARMTRMIDQVLDLTRVQLGGGIRVAPVATDLCGLVQDAVAEAVTAVPDCRFEVRAEGTVEGRWDPDRLAQVLSNLLGNAARFCLHDPVSVTLDGTAPGRVVVRVHNAAVIAPELQQVMFEPFRERAQRGGGSSGLGLGLYISRAIVEAHGGTLQCASTPDEGTTFTVTLPRAVVPAATKTPREERPLELESA